MLIQMGQLRQRCDSPLRQTGAWFRCGGRDQCAHWWRSVEQRRPRGGHIDVHWEFGWFDEHHEGTGTQVRDSDKLR